MRPDSAPTVSRREEGYLLLGVLFMILLIMMALAIAAPQMAESIRRDKEIETVHRGMQYARAIQMYYTKFGRYPNTIDQLVKTENQRFLRKRYLDPMTGKDDWRLIHYGEAKVPTQGLFGQSAQTNGITPTGATTGGGSAPPFGASGGSPLGGGSSSLGAPGSGFGSSGSSFGAGSSTSPFGGSGSSSSPIGGTDSSSSNSFGSSPGIGGTSTTSTGGTTNGIGGTQTTGSSGAFGSPGVSVGGAPIVGVGLLSKKTSIKIYKKQTHYNQWEFVFDPTQNTVAAVGGNLNGSTNGTGVNGGPGNGLGASNGLGGGASNGSGFGSSNGSGFGSSNGLGGGASNGSGFGSSNGSGFGSSNGSGFGGSPTNPGSPTAPNSYPPQ